MVIFRPLLKEAFENQIKHFVFHPLDIRKPFHFSLLRTDSVPNLPLLKEPCFENTDLIKLETFLKKSHDFLLKF